MRMRKGLIPVGMTVTQWKCWSVISYRRTQVFDGVTLLTCMKPNACWRRLLCCLCSCQTFSRSEQYKAYSTVCFYCFIIKYSVCKNVGQFSVRNIIRSHMIFLVTLVTLHSPAIPSSSFYDYILLVFSHSSCYCYI